MPQARSQLTPAEAALLEASRRAVLATTAPDGRPRLVPLAYAIDPEPNGLDGGSVLYSALDEKPKSIDDPRRLARVRDILARPQVALLVDRWSEDWRELAWLRLDATATIIEPDGEQAPEHARAVMLLRRRYPQYAAQRLESRPIIRLVIERAKSWGLEG